MEKRLGYKQVNKLLFLFTIIFITFQIGIIVYSTIIGEDVYQKNIYLNLLINQYAIILLPVVLFVLIGRYSFKEVFRLRPIGLKQVLLIAVMSVPAYFMANALNNIVVYFLQYAGKIPNTPIPAAKSFSELLIQIVVICMSPAICEEALHRGVLLSGYEEKGSYRAVFITAVIFGIFHFDILNLVGPIFLGIIIGYYVIRSNSIIAGFIAHFMNNFIASLLQFIYGRESEYTPFISIKGSDLVSILIIGVISLIIFVFLFKEFIKVTDNSNIQRSTNKLRHDIVSVILHWPALVVLIIYVLITGLFLSNIAKL